MSDYGDGVKIEKATNGYSVCLDDPAIVKANQKRDSKAGYTPYRSPRKEYVFKTVAEVLAFLKKNLDKAMPTDEYGSSFDAAIAAPDRD